MQIIANTDTTWKKEEVNNFTVYKKMLKFGQIRYFESGKALFTGQLGLSKKQKDGSYVHSNLELQIWGDDAERLADILNYPTSTSPSYSKGFCVSITGGSLEGAGYVGKNGEVKKIALANPQQVIIHCEDPTEVKKINELQEMPF